MRCISADLRTYWPTFLNHGYFVLCFGVRFKINFQIIYRKLLNIFIMCSIVTYI